MTHFQGTQQGTEKEWFYSGENCLAKANSTEWQGYCQWQCMTAGYSVIWDDKKLVPILWVFPKIPQPWSVHEKTSGKPRLRDIQTGYLVSPDHGCDKVRINRYLWDCHRLQETGRYHDKYNLTQGDINGEIWQICLYIYIFIYVYLNVYLIYIFKPVLELAATYLC